MPADLVQGLAEPRDPLGDPVDHVLQHRRQQLARIGERRRAVGEALDQGSSAPTAL
ncbi:MAG: hypothetical protein U1E17_08395 [Geminicoccaceae bacterium]